jgi:hypothetical protein
LKKRSLEGENFQFEKERFSIKPRHVILVNCGYHLYQEAMPPGLMAVATYLRRRHHLSCEILDLLGQEVMHFDFVHDMSTTKRSPVVKVSETLIQLQKAVSCSIYEWLHRALNAPGNLIKRTVSAGSLNAAGW